MFESEHECINNCMNIYKRTHLLFRDFGLNEVDKPVYLPEIRRAIQYQIATYYPAATLNNINIKQVERNGRILYAAEIAREF